MGRKKLNKQKVDQSNSTISYSGEVKVELRRGSVIIKSSKYKNAGNWPLFYFLGLNLIGSYTQANNYIPKFIKLYNIGNKGDSTISVQDKFKQENLVTLTTPIYTVLPYIEKHEGTIGVADDQPEVKVIFKFVIPFTQLASNRTINMFALYDQTNKETLTNPSAYFVLTKQENNVTVLDGIDADDSTANDYNLFIQWVMTIKNQD